MTSKGPFRLKAFYDSMILQAGDGALDWGPSSGLCVYCSGGRYDRGSPVAPLHQPRGTGGHSVNTHASPACLISNREGYKVLGSGTALHVNSGQDENVTCWFCLYKQYLAYSVPEFVSCAVYFFC